MSVKAISRKREEARRLFLTGESHSNAEIARHLGLKPHTVGRWRKEENWDDLKLKVDCRAAEKLVEQISTDRISLNVKHFRFWEVFMTRLADALKKPDEEQIKALERLASILERAQKGQRLARGLSLDGQTEEQARAEAQAENRTLIDIFIDAVKANVNDPQVRDRIRDAILARLVASDPEAEPPGTGAAAEAS